MIIRQDECVLLAGHFRFRNIFLLRMCKCIFKKYKWVEENVFVMENAVALREIRKIEYSAFWGRVYKREYFVDIEFDYQDDARGFFKGEITKVHSLTLLPDLDFSSDYQEIGNGSAIHLYGWQNRLASKNRA